MDESSKRSQRLQRMLDQQEIRDVIYRYCRGIDRRDYELVRSCYHPDAIDNHGDFQGSIGDFIEYVQATLPRFERTMHFIGNVLVEPDGDCARSESYAVAYHHLAATATKPERDFNTYFRYVDDFERRHGEWRIATRICVFEWSRVDPATSANWVAPARSIVGQSGPSDVVFAKTLPRVTKLD